MSIQKRAFQRKDEKLIDSMLYESQTSDQKKEAQIHSLVLRIKNE
jgi:hypothetical protein